MQFGDVIAFYAVSYGDSVEAEHVRQHASPMRIVHRDVYPYEYVRSLDQPWEILLGALINTVLGHQIDVDGHHQPFPAAPTTSCTAHCLRPAVKDAVNPERHRHDNPDAVEPIALLFGAAQ